MSLSNEQFDCLQKLYEQKIMLVEPSLAEICKFLHTNGYIEMISILAVDKSKPYPPDELHTNDVDIIIQITEKGKAYVDSHVAKKRNVRIELVLSITAILISIVFGILGLIF